MWRSTDGGETWALEPGVKDDYQDIWIDPNNPNRIIATCDGGTQVTLTGGKTWSTFSNQSGTQLYRVDIDKPVSVQPLHQRPGQHCLQGGLDAI